MQPLEKTIYIIYNEKNIFSGICITIYTKELKISEPKDKGIEIIQNEERKINVLSCDL